MKKRMMQLAMACFLAVPLTIAAYGAQEQTSQEKMDDKMAGDKMKSDGMQDSKMHSKKEKKRKNKKDQTSPQGKMSGDGMKKEDMK